MAYDVRNFGATLRDFRHREGITQKGLAEAVGLTPSTIALYETERRIPSLAVAARIADFFSEELGTFLSL